MNHVIDLRSDTVTRPTPEMRKAMAEAEVGDDVFGEDPTVNRLERTAAGMTGHEAALFVSSGTQGNLLGIMAHCGRGDEYIVGQQAHCYRVEGGGAAVLGSVQPQPLEMRADGTLDLDEVAAAIKPDDFHYARTRLVCLENTQGGKVLPLDYIDDARELTRERGLGLHLDGARVFNAAVKLGVPVERITSRFDSVSICLSKGLGAPVGSLLVGSRTLIEAARRWRKVVGGGTRQAGVLAAAGQIALEQHVDRMADDHANARRLAEGMAGNEALVVDPEKTQTNMFFIDVRDGRAGEFAEHMAARGILVKARSPMRIVTHLDVGERDVDTAIEAARAFG